MGTSLSWTSQYGYIGFSSPTYGFPVNDAIGEALGIHGAVAAEDEPILHLVLKTARPIRSVTNQAFLKLLVSKVRKLS